MTPQSYNLRDTVSEKDFLIELKNTIQNQFQQWSRPGSGSLNSFMDRKLPDQKSDVLHYLAKIDDVVNSEECSLHRQARARIAALSPKTGFFLSGDLELLEARSFARDVYANDYFAGILTTRRPSSGHVLLDAENHLFLMGELPDIPLLKNTVYGYSVDKDDRVWWGEARPGLKAPQLRSKFTGSYQLLNADESVRFSVSDDYHPDRDPLYHADAEGIGLIRTEQITPLLYEKNGHQDPTVAQLLARFAHIIQASHQQAPEKKMIVDIRLDEYSQDKPLPGVSRSRMPEKTPSYQDLLTDKPFDPVQQRMSRYLLNTIEAVLRLQQQLIESGQAKDIHLRLAIPNPRSWEDLGSSPFFS